MNCLFKVSHCAENMWINLEQIEQLFCFSSIDENCLEHIRCASSLDLPIMTFVTVFVMEFAVHALYIFSRLNVFQTVNS